MRLHHYRNGSSPQWTFSEDLIPISSIEFDYKPNIQPATDTQIEEGNLYTNMEKMIEVWKHLDSQEGRHPKMVDVDIIGGGGDINSLDLDREQLVKISSHSKHKGELQSRSSNPDIESDKMTVPADDMENHVKTDSGAGLVHSPNTILQESGWRPLLLGSLLSDSQRWRPSVVQSGQE